MFHSFLQNIGKVNLPRQFTFPFYYEPHPLSIKAAEEVRSYLIEQKQWEKELSEGKMFGVLVVQDIHLNLGFLAAFSGQIANSYLHDYFVPPVYDLNDEASFFRKEEQVISNLNLTIEKVESSEAYQSSISSLSILQENLKSLKLSWKQKLTEAKQHRDSLREKQLSVEDEQMLVKESQFLKAESKRCLKIYEEKVKAAEEEVNRFEQELNDLRQRRKQLSATLQNRLFENFRFLNALGEEKSLTELFLTTVPPSGAGECAAPKLLQYAYKNHLKPICMAEFWWGKSPKSIIRKHGSFYPSCYSKCKPILTFMLQGLNVEENPLASHFLTQLPIVYEDEWLLVVNKPSGVLSVPGTTDLLSVESFLQTKYSFCKAVHRLDMATSGLLVFAKTEQVYKNLQLQFATRKVTKRYLALLSGRVTHQRGVVDLPLCPDIEHRPCQMVDYQYGKSAVTRYEVIEELDDNTKVWFYPQTGRTHQLRIHAAHPDGLNCPIVGDELYGEKSQRLYLQAQMITFTHPVTKQLLSFELPLDF